MRILKIKNYEKYQTHRTKNPKWIKLYSSLLTDRDFLKLDIMSRYLYVGLLILASETGNNVINDSAYLCQRLAIPWPMSGHKGVNGRTESGHDAANERPPLDLSPLFRSGLLVASERTVRRMGGKISTSETETETEKTLSLSLSSDLSASPPKIHRGKRQISEEDKPTEKHFTFGMSLGLDVGPEWGKFKNYCLAHDKRYANFEAAFRNWLANAAERRVHVVR